MTTAEIARRALAEYTAARPAGELLSRFASRRDPEAFAGLVHQFGPMVLGVCRRVLGPTPDADDAFQAVFVSLARQADSFRDAAALPAWLHRVALRTSRKALAARHNPQPAAAEPADAADPFADVAWRDVRRVLDEEIDALPEKLRGPVVLCWLDGLTQDEAAGKLGVSLNTLKRRLCAGRDLLRSRLTRRGLAPALAATSLVVPGGLRATVPGALWHAAASAARIAKPLAVAGPRLIALAAVGALAACGLAFVPADPAPQVAPEPRPVAQAKPADAPPAEPLPKGAVARFGGTQFRVPERLYSYAPSPDGKLIAVGGNFGVRLHEAATWRLVHDLPMDAGRSVYNSNHLTFSPDGKVLGFTKNGRFAYLWDV
ncbi:MAG TPA: sigma-70 family RNA polymerase sigma factor, partial [Gemmata sp.]|nr:sigma-70 family RNA polymerase sigma factor [Gemmata sp.]